jgi:integrase/recombinase XerD
MGVKGARYPAETLTPDEVRSLLAACGGDSLSAVRNHALIVTLWRAGLRCSEALSLRPVDVDFGRGSIRVLHGKGRKARTVGIDDTALAVLAVWIERRQLAGIPGDLLFPTLVRRPGSAMSSRYVRAVVGRLAEKAGIGHRVHPHAMRHTHAVELSREGWSVPLISRQLGHSSIATTDTYLNHLFPAEVIDRAHARTWG